MFDRRCTKFAGSISFVSISATVCRRSFHCGQKRCRVADADNICGASITRMVVGAEPRKKPRWVSNG
eukprot:12881146-Prorocentrum_lima.AAC.1